ncbi:hypothetical protein [Schauerella aestuarii]|uniref:hypothetical protein n=1 Tax=Schauerella aestuarii TaxID=2511204 RepID=UPI002E2A870D|nr:hypothetical protein [Achromobacter aestuarii]
MLERTAAASARVVPADRIAGVSVSVAAAAADTAKALRERADVARAVFSAVARDAAWRSASSAADFFDRSTTFTFEFEAAALVFFAVDALVACALDFELFFALVDLAVDVLAAGVLVALQAADLLLVLHGSARAAVAGVVPSTKASAVAAPVPNFAIRVQNDVIATAHLLNVKNYCFGRRPKNTDELWGYGPNLNEKSS